jgi:hypothetical protein
VEAKLDMGLVELVSKARQSSNSTSTASTAGRLNAAPMADILGDMKMADGTWWSTR